MSEHFASFVARVLRYLLIVHAVKEGVWLRILMPLNRDVPS